ncbi:MAG: hypothetical protein Q8N60_03295 [Candidatus Diapherotrites archaeon]|nr:hypothetical protein [Candidatus Diapherotrites archaeon]
MRKSSANRVRPRLTMRDVFNRGAFRRSGSKGLTPQSAFRAKVMGIIGQIEKDQGRNQVQIGRHNVPITTEQFLIEMRDVAQTAFFRRKLLETPKVAAWIAREMHGTKYEKYFAKIAKKAAKRAEKERQKKVIAAKKAAERAEKERQRKIIAAKEAARRAEKERQREMIRKIAARRREIR